MNDDKIHLIIPGVHKGGTTSLYNYLSQHPAIHAPLKKELHFFTPLVYQKPISGSASYSSLFTPKKNERYLLDVSPSYLYGTTDVIQAIQKEGSVKILLILRNPSDRFISFYKQGISTGRIPSNLSLIEFFNASKAAYTAFLETGHQQDTFVDRGLREGMYSYYMRPWLDAFGDQLKIIYFESLKTNPEKTMASVCEWLEIENHYSEFNFKAENQSFKPKSARVSALANRLFLKFERFFRKNPGIKEAIKKIYTKFNRSEYDKPSSDTTATIKEFYLYSINEFNQLMSEYKREKTNW